MEIEAADDEGKLVSQVAEKREHVVDGAGEGDGNRADAPTAQIGQGVGVVIGGVPAGPPRRAARHGLHPRCQRRPGRAGPPPAIRVDHMNVIDPVGDPVGDEAVPSRRARLEQDIRGARPDFAQNDAHRHAVLEGQEPDVLVQRAQKVVVELARKHAEERTEAFRAESARLPIRNPAQLLEAPAQQLERYHRSVEQPIGIIVLETAPYLPFRGEGIAGQLIQFPDCGCVLRTVFEDSLPIPNRVRFDQAGEHHLTNRVEDEIVILSHRPKEQFEAQVVCEPRAVGWQRALRVDVVLGVEKQNLHARIRRLTFSYESWYFSASAAA